VTAMIIVVVLPLAKSLIEQVDVVRDAILIEQLVELLVIDAMRALDLPVQVRRLRAISFQAVIDECDDGDAIVNRAAVTTASTSDTAVAVTQCVDD
jgi:hypothetical protein